MYRIHRANAVLQKLISPQTLIDLCNESFSIDLTQGGGSIPAAGTCVFDTVPRNGYKRIQMPLFAMGFTA